VGLGSRDAEAPSAHLLIGPCKRVVPGLPATCVFARALRSRPWCDPEQQLQSFADALPRGCRAF
jgi:hypothetical protein